MNREPAIHPDGPLPRRDAGALAAQTACENIEAGRPRSSRRGAVLFEALMAIVILILSVFAFSALFTSNTTRMSKARDRRETAVFADDILSSLRAASDEEARRTNWLSFWQTNAYVTNGPAVVVGNASGRLPIRYSVSVTLTNNSAGLPNCATVLVQAWPGEHRLTNEANGVRMYAEFWDTGAL